MPALRLQVLDSVGEREVALDHFPYTIGRRDTNDLRLAGSEVSREHAEIAEEEGRMVLRDRESRYGTFVNGEQIAECEVRPGDRIRLGRGGGADLVLTAASEDHPTGRSATGARDDLRQITAP